jgi:hypothetical protein
MSQTMLAENGAAATAPEPTPRPDGAKTYRGETLDELLPQIRAELGPDAVVLRQREGLAGGVAGFFQKRCVEVDARPGVPRVDVYDEPAHNPAPAPADAGWDDEPAEGGWPPAAFDAPVPSAAATPAVPATPAASAPAPEPHPVRNDAATREGLATDGVRKLVDQAQPFADLLDELTPKSTFRPQYGRNCGFTDETEAPGADSLGNAAGTGDVPAAERPPAADAPSAPPSAAPSAPRAAERLRAALADAGLGEDLADGIVGDVVASRLPFATPGRLRTLVRDELALRIPVAPAAAPGPRALAVVGPAGSGKTAAVAALAAAHAAAGGDVICVTISPADGGAALTALLAGSGVEAVVLDRAAPDPALAERLARGLVVVDTPAAWAGSPDIEKLARRLRKLGVGEVHLALRAGSGRRAAAELIDGLARLRPDRLLVTGAAETAHLGAAADAAIRSSLPLGYVADGPAALAPVDVRALAARIVT